MSVLLHDSRAPASVALRAVGMEAGFGRRAALHGIDLDIYAGEVLAIIGPSGCGKSTFIRCLNRLHETARGGWVRGRVELDGVDIYGPRVSPALLRREVGMVFAQPNPFPSMSIRDNVLAGLRLTGRLRALDASPDAVVEDALQQAALWDEVSDRLQERAEVLTAGQRQRLCIARALAMSPSVLLMDEPCSTLDPIATAQIEDVIDSLRERCTVVLVTHSLQQAARASDRTAFFSTGRLIESAPTGELFTSPQHPQTEDYITGRTG